MEGQQLSSQNIWQEASSLACWKQVIEAKGIVASDRSGLSDPYCRLRVGETEARTKTINKCLHPSWNETFVFAAADLEASQGGRFPAQLGFELWNSDYFARDAFLGQVFSFLLPPIHHITRLQHQPCLLILWLGCKSCLTSSSAMLGTA